MSNYNTQLQSNNTDLQSLINKARNLPDAVNIDDELSTQDDLIAQIQAAVDNLPEAGGNNSTTSELKIAYVATTDTAMYSNIVVFNQGMTWNDFCNSEYNIRYAKVNGSPQQKTFLCVYSDNSIWDTDNMGYRLATETTDWTIGSDEIIEGNIYIMHYDD